MAIEVQGEGGESLVFDGASVAKYRHHGRQEAARNPSSTYRGVQVTPVTSLFGKVKQPPRWNVLLTMASIMSLTVDEAGKAQLDRLVAALDATAR